MPWNKKKRGDKSKKLKFMLCIVTKFKYFTWIMICLCHLSCIFCSCLFMFNYKEQGVEVNVLHYEQDGTLLLDLFLLAFTMQAKTCSKPLKLRLGISTYLWQMLLPSTVCMLIPPNTLKNILFVYFKAHKKVRFGVIPLWNFMCFTSYGLCWPNHAVMAQAFNIRYWYIMLFLLCYVLHTGVIIWMRNLLLSRQPKPCLHGGNLQHKSVFLVFWMWWHAPRNENNAKEACFLATKHLGHDLSHRGKRYLSDAFFNETYAIQWQV